MILWAEVLFTTRTLFRGPAEASRAKPCLDCSTMFPTGTLFRSFPVASGPVKFRMFTIKVPGTYVENITNVFSGVPIDKIQRRNTIP